MGSFTSAQAIHGRVHVNDYNGNTTEVAREDVRKLMDACISALSQPDSCACGDERKEIVEHQDSASFLPRTGCTRCNRWDGPPVLRRP